MSANLERDRTQSRNLELFQLFLEPCLFTGVLPWAVWDALLCG